MPVDGGVYLYRDLGLDGLVTLVIAQLDVAEREVEQAGDVRIQYEGRRWERLAGKLLIDLIEMVGVQVDVAANPDQLAGYHVHHLRHHVRQDGVGRHIERHPEEHVA